MPASQNGLHLQTKTIATVFRTYSPILFPNAIFCMREIAERQKETARSDDTSRFGTCSLQSL